MIIIADNKVTYKPQIKGPNGQLIDIPLDAKTVQGKDVIAEMNRMVEELERIEVEAGTKIVFSKIEPPDLKENDIWARILN